MLGLTLLICSTGLTATVDAIAKALSGQMHAIQITWGYFAGISVTVLVFAISRPGGLRQALSSNQPVRQVLRSAALVGTIVLLFVGLTYIPLADAIAITFATPLLITILAVPLLGERGSWSRWLAVLVGLVGVVVIIRPAGSLLHWAALMPLASALFFALYQIMTRQLAAQERTLTTLLYTALGGLLWSSLAVVFVWQPVDLADLGVFAVIGVLGAAAHLCIIKAFASAEASLLAPFNYFKLLWAVALGYAVFGDVPGMHVVVGSAIIVTSGLYVVLSTRER